jgi:hypothetical protein
MKMYDAVRIQLHCFDLGTGWRWVVSFTLYPQYPLARRLRGPHSRSGRYGIGNKQFWEELITYIPLIQHKPHRKRHVQQFYCWIFIAVAT